MDFVTVQLYAELLLRLRENFEHILSFFSLRCTIGAQNGADAAKIRGSLVQSS